MSEKKESFKRSKSNVHILHHNDMDGFFSAFLAAVGYSKFFARVVSFYKMSSYENIYYLTKEKYDGRVRLSEFEDNFISLDHVKDVPTNFTKEDTVIIVDYAFGKKEYNFLEEILKNAGNVIWIDHHKTSIDSYEDHPEWKDIPGIRSTEFCATYLTQIYFHCIDTIHHYYELMQSVKDGKLAEYVDKHDLCIPEYIKLVDDWDCWKHKLKDTKRFKYGYDVINPDSPAHPFFAHMRNDYENIMDNRLVTDIGDMIIRYNEERFNNYRNFIKECKTSFEENGQTYIGKVAAINYPIGNSDLFGDLIHEYDLCVLWYFNGEKYVYSYYSDQNDETRKTGRPAFNCAKACAELGGGGHPGAAGFTSDKPFNELVELYHIVLNYDNNIK